MGEYGHSGPLVTTARIGSCDSKWACCDFAGVHQQGPKEMPTLLNICGPLWCREAPVTLISFHNRIILFLYCTKEYTKYYCTPDKKLSLSQCEITAIVTVL
jgi:hypothetical protein